jgi:membrane associated rhomboid family serine protease
MQDHNNSSDTPAAEALPETGEAGGEPQPAVRRPIIGVMTLSMIGVNFLLALIQMAMGGFGGDDARGFQDLSDWALGAKVSSLIAHGEYWRLVTANFLHAGWLHLLGNMAGLFVLGRLVEAFYGQNRFLVIYVLSAVAGGIASYFFTPEPSLGASTAVMGLMGALLAHNLKYRRYLPRRFLQLTPALFGMVLLTVVTDRLVGMNDGNGHLGGLLGGMIVAWLLERRFQGVSQADRDWLPLPTALATAVGLLLFGFGGLALSLPAHSSLLQAGRADTPRKQVAILEDVLQKRPYLVEARVPLGDLLFRVGRRDEAIAQYEQALKLNLTPMTASAVRARLFAAHLDKAMRATRQKQPQAAVEQYRRAIFLLNGDALLRERIPAEEQALAQNNYAWTLVDELHTDLDRAEAAAQQAVKLAPKMGTYLDTLAWVHYYQGKYELALQEQLQALRKPDAGSGQNGTAELQYHLGAIYEKLGRTSDARVAYQRALGAMPTFQPAREGLDRLSRLDGGRGAPPPREPDPAVVRGII